MRSSMARQTAPVATARKVTITDFIVIFFMADAFLAPCGQALIDTKSMTGSCVESCLLRYLRSDLAADNQKGAPGQPGWQDGLN